MSYFLSPAYPLEMQDYTRGLAEVGANVIGVGEGPLSSLPPKVRRYLSDYIQVPRLFDEQSLIAHILNMQKANILIVRIFVGTIDPSCSSHSSKLGIPGMSPETVLGFRDKSVMKERVAKAGLRVPYAFRCLYQP